MAGPSKIEWTEATWNPIVGCSVLSPGCTNCYAMTMAARLEAMAGTCLIDADDARQSYYDTVKKVKGKAVWTGKVAQAPDHVLLAPLKRKKPTTYFVNSMGDLFHENIPDEWIDKVFAVMALCRRHTFQVLTKRALRMRTYLSDPNATVRWLASAKAMTLPAGALFQPWQPLPHVWLGVSTERQQEADERIPHLLQTPAAVRFISAEPLLGPIDLRKVRERLSGESFMTFDALDHPDTLNRGRCRQGLDWVIVGGESGHGARPMHPDWARLLRDQCARTGVPLFFKQWGSWKDGSDFANDESVRAVTNDGRVIDPDLKSLSEHDRIHTVTNRNPTLMRRVGKKAAGRLLDGKEHNAMPEIAA